MILSIFLLVDLFVRLNEMTEPSESLLENEFNADGGDGGSWIMLILTSNGTKFGQIEEFACVMADASKLG